jgi:hypothetical protein
MLIVHPYTLRLPGSILAVAVGELGGRPIVVSASDDFTVRVWDLAAGKPLGGLLEGHDNIVNAVAVGELGGRPIAVSGGCDKLVWVWDLAAGGPLGEPLVHDHFVTAVAVGELHDRSLAASSDAKQTVRPVVATTRPAPGREAAMPLGSRRVEQGGSASSGGRSDKAGGRRDRRAAPARGSAAVTTKPRWWQVVSLQRGVVLSILLLFGIGAVGVGVKELVDSKRFLATASSANGVVVDVARVIERRQEGSGNQTHYKNVPVYYPVVEFVTAREQVVRFQADEGSEKRSAYGVGALIRVLYDPANPRDARLDTWVSRLGNGIFIGSFGLLFVVLVTVIYWVMLRSSRRTARRVAPQNPQPQESERRADG